MQSSEPFSFDEFFGMVVDSLQIYGNEVIKLRKQNESFREMIKTLEENLVGETEEADREPARPHTPAATSRTKRLEQYVVHARDLAKKMYRPPIDFATQDEFAEAEEAASFEEAFKNSLKSPKAGVDRLVLSRSSSPGSSRPGSSEGGGAAEDETVKKLHQELDGVQVMQRTGMKKIFPKSGC